MTEMTTCGVTSLRFSRSLKSYLASLSLFSLGHVKRIIRRMGLRIRQQMSGIEEVVATVGVSRDFPS